MKEIKGAPSPVFGTADAVKHPAEVGDTMVGMIEAGIKSPSVKKLYPHAEMIPLIGPILQGANFITSFFETYNDILARDKRIRDAMDNSPGHDLDPRDVGYIAGQDFADGYQYYVKTGFSL